MENKKRAYDSREQQIEEVFRVLRLTAPSQSFGGRTTNAPQPPSQRTVSTRFAADTAPLPQGDD